MNSSLMQRADNQAIAHMAWCALVALSLAAQDGHISRQADENDYLANWFTSALREKLFSAKVDIEINWLLNQFIKYGNDTSIKEKLTILWNNSCGKITKESDLLRLTLAIAAATKKEWIYKLIAHHQWEAYALSLSKNSFNCIMINHNSLNEAFDEKGMQRKPIEALIIGKRDELISFLKSHEWHASNDIGCRYFLNSVKRNSVFSF